ncbi:SDR family oxidoreductase [Paraconexibacter antarcticus]|uniref:SDR family oxidoreductase n=1 Tax=Paraconexibacter antarcticus TaxID=2949664 RepID=A0ABY5DP71_9ACTN|nr:SDR family oxidoreductase [Paraconexibacter antarcticus]UTI62857.1 SDR family oxidoreductase [Paraconexibacter antarcticus]
MTLLLTGATGFLGMELLVRAVEADDRDVICVIRAADDAHAARRLADTLARLYGDEVPPAADRRLRAVAGDLERDGLGLGDAARADVAATVTRIVHSAATISFDLPLEEARAVNVAGTRQVLALGRAIHADGRLERYVHVSTAYVAGRHAGAVAEDDRTVAGEPRNTYEQTKREAEALVFAAMDDGLPVVVARPSIVVGDSHTGWTPAFNVLYFPLRALARRLLVEVPADPASLVDAVPIDYVADAITHLATTDGPVSGAYHLTAGGDVPSLGAMLEVACGILGCPVPRVEAPTAVLDAEAGDHQGGVFVPYFDVHSHYETARARAVLEPAGITCPPLLSYFTRLTDYALAANWGKTGVPRAEAVRDAAVRV